jgi:hypothetical protein
MAENGGEDPKNETYQETGESTTEYKFQKKKIRLTASTQSMGTLVQ